MDFWVVKVWKRTGNSIFICTKRNYNINWLLIIKRWNINCSKLDPIESVIVNAILTSSRISRAGVFSIWDMFPVPEHFPFYKVFWSYHSISILYCFLYLLWILVIWHHSFHLCNFDSLLFFEFKLILFIYLNLYCGPVIVSLRGWQLWTGSMFRLELLFNFIVITAVVSGLVMTHDNIVPWRAKCMQVCFNRYLRLRVGEAAQDALDYH